MIAQDKITPEKLQKYKELTNTFNTLSSNNNQLIKPYTTKSNSLLIEEYNALTTTLQNKLRDYQFSSLEDVNKSIDNYKQGSERLLLQLKEGEATIVKQSNSLLNLKLTEIA